MATIPEPEAKTVRFLEKSAHTVNQPVKNGEVLIRKMRTFVSRMDMDGDGYLTRRDYELLAERYAEKANFEPGKSGQVMQQLQQTWDSVFGPEANQHAGGRLTGEQMSESLIRRGRDMCVAMAAICFSTMYDLMNVEKKGYVTLENFRVFHILLNVKDENETRQTFESMDENGDRRLSFMEFLQAGIDYFVTNDIDSPYNTLFGPLVE